MCAGVVSGHITEKKMIKGPATPSTFHSESYGTQKIEELGRGKWGYEDECAISL